jgi:hypothetical protein
MINDAKMKRQKKAMFKPGHTVAVISPPLNVDPPRMVNQMSKKKYKR